MITGTGAEYESDAGFTKAPLTSPERVSYEVSFVNTCLIIDRVIRKSHCIYAHI